MPTKKRQPKQARPTARGVSDHQLGVPSVTSRCRATVSDLLLKLPPEDWVEACDAIVTTALDAVAVNMDETGREAMAEWLFRLHEALHGGASVWDVYEENRRRAAEPDPSS